MLRRIAAEFIICRRNKRMSELTNEEVMKISHAGSDKMREIILEKT